MSDEIFPADDRVAEFKRAIEAVILVAQDPVAPEILAQLLEQPVGLIERWCDELAGEYNDDQRGFELARVAGGYRYQTHADQTPYVERFVLHDQKARLSGAALETLAIIAYKQPISRAQVASIRGVDPDGVIRTLQARGYIGESGRDDGPGQAVLFGTTEAFLEKLGLDSLDDLPPIAEFIPGADVVETLEQGLRVDPVDVSTPPVSDSDASSDYAPATEQPDQASANGDRELADADGAATPSELGDAGNQDDARAGHDLAQADDGDGPVDDDVVDVDVDVDVDDVVDGDVDDVVDGDVDDVVDGDVVDAGVTDSQPDHVELADPETAWTQSAPAGAVDGDDNDDEFAFEEADDDLAELDSAQRAGADDSSTEGRPEVGAGHDDDDDARASDSSTVDDLAGDHAASDDAAGDDAAGGWTFGDDDVVVIESSTGDDDGWLSGSSGLDSDADTAADIGTTEHQPDEHDGDAD